MSLSNTVEHEMLTDFLTRHPSLYLAASTTDPGEDGSGITEPTTGGYARAIVGDVTLTGNQITNDVSILFNAATASWGTITHIAVFDADTGGAFCGSEEIDPVVVAMYVRMSIASGTVIVSLD